MADLPDIGESGREAKVRSTTGDRSDPEVARCRKQLAEMIREIRRGGTQLANDTLDGWVYSAATARALIRAARHHSDDIHLSGEVTGNLAVPGEVTGDLVVLGEVRGHLIVRGEVRRRLTVLGGVGGDLTVRGEVGGYLSVPGGVGGDLSVLGGVGGGLSVSGEVGEHLIVLGEVGDDLIVRGEVGGGLIVPGGVGGDLFVSGGVGGDLTVSGEVGGYMSVPGGVGGDLVVSGEVGGHLIVRGEVGGHLAVLGEVTGYLSLRGEVGGNLVVSGGVGGDLSVSGRMAGCRLVGRVDGRTVLTPYMDSEGPVPLLSVRSGRFSDEVFVGNGVDISATDFRQCPDLDRLLLAGSDLFPEGVEALANPPAGSDEMVPHLEMASIYRRLRTNLESRQNRASAGIFYRGEMDSRRMAASERRRWAEWTILTLYRGMSGYGLVARRAFGWFVGVVLVGACLYYFTAVGFDPYANQPDLDLFGTIQFSFESTLGLLRPPGDDLQFWERWLQLIQRVAGPVLLTQIVLAVRERVAR